MTQGITRVIHTEVAAVLSTLLFQSLWGTESQTVSMHSVTHLTTTRTIDITVSLYFHQYRVTETVRILTNQNNRYCGSQGTFQYRVTQCPLSPTDYHQNNR